MLTYEYKPGSTLLRREFVVSCRMMFADGTDGYGSWPVTAPDPVAARRVTAEHLNDLLADDDKFTVECVREVVMVWHPKVAHKVPLVRVHWRFC